MTKTLKHFAVRVLRPIIKAAATLAGPVNGGRWLTIFDQYSGAWQQDVSLDQPSILRYSAVFRCIALIAGDIAKLQPELKQQDADGVWLPTTNPAYSPVLRRPNLFQTWLEFISYWIISLLVQGNTYVLKRRDGAGRVVGMTVLDPTGVTPLVSPSGDVFYRFGGTDWLAGIVDQEIPAIPASEIIHDKYLCLNHPLIGNSPLQVAGAAATAGIKIAQNVAKFFTNQALPAGVIESPEDISQEQAQELKTAWQGYTGDSAGKVAILENGLKFTPLSVKFVDAQMLETLRFTQEQVCQAFGVPAWKLGVGVMPASGNAEISERGYYQQTLQIRIESIEALLDHGLGLTDRADLGVELCLDGLFRLDTLNRYKAHREAIAGGWKAPNEVRRAEGLKKVPGGDSPMMQQQNYSLEALAKRDAKPDPFGKPPAPAGAKPPGEQLPPDAAAKLLADVIARELQA